jgi:hypothetical protein
VTFYLMLTLGGALISLCVLLPLVSDLTRRTK